MKKNRQYFLRIAILKTMATGFMYLMMPLVAKIYYNYVGGIYEGYTIFGSAIMIIGNLILLVRAWFIAFDAGLREQVLKD